MSTPERPDDLDRINEILERAENQSVENPGRGIHKVTDEVLDAAIDLLKDRLRSTAGDVVHIRARTTVNDLSIDIHVQRLARAYSLLDGDSRDGVAIERTNPNAKEARYRAWWVEDKPDLVTDGGVEEIPACPECDSPSVRSTNSKPYGKAPRADYRCASCGAWFDEPDYRERYHERPDHTCSVAANALIDADPDIVTDGGFSEIQFQFGDDYFTLKPERHEEFLQRVEDTGAEAPCPKVAERIVRDMCEPNDEPELVTDGGRTDRDILAELDEGDAVQFEATKDDGRLLAQMHHGHVSAILDERNDVQRVDVEPHKDDDLKLASNVRNRDRLRLRAEGGAVTVYSLDRDGAREYDLGRTNGTLNTPDMGGGSKVLVADGGTDEDPLLTKIDPGHWPEHARRVRGESE